KILVIDAYHQHAATQVAAGLFNPVTGRLMTKTWKADVLFPYLHQFYRQAEHLTGKQFFYPMPVYRPFISVEEQNEWMGKSANADLAAYIDTIRVTPTHQALVKNDYGGLTLKQCGYLDTVTFTRAIRDYLIQKDALLNATFHENALTFTEAGVEYEKFRAGRIILCQGVNALTGKLFSWLPIRPLKGETLSLQTDQTVSVIYNRGVYVVPHIWKVGATYQHDCTPEVTRQARLELTEKLDALIAFPYKIITQSWGMRPTTPDRRPILGPHPGQSKAVIFNGLGTKGVSLAPYFSEVLTTWLENKAPINKEVDIQRYKHYNYGGNFPR
ncbi:MAG TPA: FAD-dependent oxidoreductase, partial [Cyclobacteriaceae bacterium]|nr:FAD-dependent oxidoreductase [Cyclobacteriaceae bacterium]